MEGLTPPRLLRADDGKFGFADLPFDPNRAMVVRIVDLIRSGIAD